MRRPKPDNPSPLLVHLCWAPCKSQAPPANISILKRTFSGNIKFVHKEAIFLLLQSQVLSSTSGNSSKFFVSSIAVTLTGKAAGRSLITRKRLSIIVADGGADEDVDGLPDVLPVDCVEPGQLFHLVHTRDPE